METGNAPVVVRVTDLIGENGEDEGRQLNELIRASLVAGRDVELDFHGVSALTEPFLMAAVAGLLDEIPFDDLLRRLIVSNMTVRDVQALRFVLERARLDAPECSVGAAPQPGEPENP